MINVLRVIRPMMVIAVFLVPALFEGTGHAQQLVSYTCTPSYCSVLTVGVGYFRASIRIVGDWYFLGQVMNDSISLGLQSR
jgi:hypothetical protein